MLFLILTGVSGNGHFNKLSIVASVMKKSNSDGCLKSKKKLHTVYGKQTVSHNTNERKEFSKSVMQRMQLPRESKSKLRCSAADCKEQRELDQVLDSKIDNIQLDSGVEQNGSGEHLSTEKGCTKGDERVVYEDKCFEVYSGDQSPNLPVSKRKASRKVWIVQQDYPAMNENLFDDLFKVKKQHAIFEESVINEASSWAAGKEFSLDFMMETSDKSLRKNKRKLDYRLNEDDVKKLLILPSKQNQRGKRKQNDRSTTKFDICSMKQLYELDNGIDISERRSVGIEEFSHGNQRIECPSVFITFDLDSDIGRESPDQRQNKNLQSRSVHGNENHCGGTKLFKRKRNENNPYEESSEKKTYKVCETENSCDASKVDQGQKKAHKQVCRSKSELVKNCSGLLELEAAKFEDFFILSNEVMSTLSCCKNFKEKKQSDNSCGRGDKGVISSKSLRYGKQKKNKWNTYNPDGMSKCSSYDTFIANAYFDKEIEMEEKCSSANDLERMEVNENMKSDDTAKSAINLDLGEYRGWQCRDGKLQKETRIEQKKYLTLRRLYDCWNIDPWKTAGTNTQTKVQKVETSKKIHIEQSGIGNILLENVQLFNFIFCLVQLSLIRFLFFVLFYISFLGFHLLVLLY